jgi:tripartite-type tricarboxylate transporter receptor subunit TctC
MASASAFAADFSGKTISIFIGNPAGSGGDVHGRVFARHFGKHIPGKPNVIVKNKPGGGGTNAMNHVYDNGKPDGTMLCYCSFNPSAVIAEAPGVRYIPEKMGPIGSINSNLAFVARRDKVDELKDILDGDPIVVGGRGAASSMGMMGNLGLKVMGANYRYIPGFKGFSKISASMKAGEVAAGHAGLSGYTKFFGDGETAYPVYYHPHFDAKGNVRPTRKAFPDDVPSIVDAHKSLHGTEPSGKWWDAYVWYRSKVMTATVAVTAPPGVGDETIQVLRDAFQATIISDAYLTEYRTTIAEPPPFNSTETTLKVFATFRDVPAGISETLLELAKK